MDVNAPRRYGIWRSSVIAALLLCIVVKRPARAEDQRISQMVHTAWTGRDGAPQGVNALAQTPDGVLWIGTLGGLYSFDGLTFQAFEPGAGDPSLPMKTVRFLFVSQAGDLWVFGYHGPPVRIRHGHVTIYGQVEADSISVLGHAQQDSKGTLWAVLNGRQLVSLGDDGIWHPRIGPIAGVGHISKLFIDSRDTQWVIENNLLYRRSVFESHFNSTGIHVDGPAKITESADHKLWIMGQGPNVPSGPDRALYLQRADLDGHRLSTPQVAGSVFDILPVADGSLWITEPDGGLERFRRSKINNNSNYREDVPEAYTAAQGLASGARSVMLRDADGNIWVGGMAGMDRFHYATLLPAIGSSPAGFWSMCITPEGDVWAVDQQGPNFVLRGGQPTEIRGLHGVSTIYCGTYGDVWVMDATGLAYVRGGHIHRLPLLPGYTGYTDHYVFQGVIELGPQDLLVSVGGATGTSLWSYKSGKWKLFLPQYDLPEITAMFQEQPGRLYLGHRNVGRATNPISLVNQGVVEPLSTGSPGLGTVAGFAQTSLGLFAFGENGVAIECGNQFQVLSFAKPDHGRTLTGLVESRDGDFWINGNRGIIHIPRSEILASLSDRDHPIDSENIQEGNFIGPDTFGSFRDSARVDATGKLWFSTLNGVLSINPANPIHSVRLPRLLIRSVSADGQPLNEGTPVPPNVQTLDIKYFGLDLTDPQKVTYRYQLEGIDRSWLDAGSRTDAIYTHLHPGRYVFRVMASNREGVWTEPSVSEFTVLPRFYQTTWFAVLCFVAIALFLWLAYALRLHFVSRAIRIRAEERADERIRIARELHDTLLQGVQGLLLTFHVAAEKVPADHQSKKTLEKALTTADRIILEGRNRVSRLRAEHLTDSELKPSIEGVAADLNRDPAIEFAVERRGGSDTLDAHVVDEIFCIAREALTNAFRYAEASCILVELDYQKRQFVFNCRDDGHGFEAHAFDASRTNGHWGLRGMAERAARIGAKFSCVSSTGAGTNVQVIVPARQAYTRTNGFRLFPRSLRQ
jgi:signal transduction histidine kinase